VILKTILSFDPLNHFARFEKYLVKPDDQNKVQFTSLIRNELPIETYLELAMWYYNSGQVVECEKVLALSPRSAETIYWLSFLKNKKVNVTDIKQGNTFPFRSESAVMLEQLLTRQDDWLLRYHLAIIYKDRNRIKECTDLLLACGESPDQAPFYATRAAILSGTDDTRCESDLKKALSIDKQWRYHLLLANFYIDHRQYEKALAITDPFYKSHPQDFIMGALHARTLLLNKKYKEADALLTKINIIPYEGATGGHELYREAKLMQAALLMQKKNFKPALKFIGEAALWPENLGVGQPYPEEIDMRLEYWMNYLCLQQLKRTSEAGEMLKMITKFEPRIDNTVRNFLPANALVTAWAYEKLNNKNEATMWLNKQIGFFPGIKLILWSKSVFEGDKSFVLNEGEKDANVRIIEQLTGAGM
jgi:hypothetical protein